MSCTNRCSTIVFVSVILFVSVSFAQNSANDVDAAAQDPRSKSDEVLSGIMRDCVNSQVDSVTTCLKLKVLHYFDYDVSRIATPRSLSDNDVEKIDRLVVKRFQKYLKSRQFEVQLPEFIFQRATLVFHPEKSLTDFDVVFPKASEAEDRSMSAVVPLAFVAEKARKWKKVKTRDMMQQKALLPLLMMLKMKLKMITPIMLTLVSIKATKAYLMSKLALLMVTLFMASQLLKKLGMHLPMLHPPPMEMPMAMPMTTPPAYGPPTAPPASSYGAPAPGQSYGSPSSSYSEPSAASWEPSSASSNSYSRVWDPQQLAYSTYYKSAPVSSASSLSSSPSSSSSSSTSTV